MEEEFKLSKNLVKTIIADTRVSILKALESRPMTASELSRFLKKHVTTISEHLDLLKNSDLIERIERPGRKWIYYKLTRSGKKILHPTSYRLVFMFAAIIFSVIGIWGIFSVDAYPGQLFYALDRGVENFQMFFITGHLTKARRHIELAEERLVEIKSSVETGNLEFVNDMVKDYTKEIYEAKEEIRIAKTKKMDVVPLLEELSEATPKHASMIENILTKTPQIEEEIKPALGASIQGYTDAIEELRNITGKPYAAEMTIRPLE